MRLLQAALSLDLGLDPPTELLLRIVGRNGQTANMDVPQTLPLPTHSAPHTLPLMCPVSTTVPLYRTLSLSVRLSIFTLSLSVRLSIELV